MFMYLTLYMHHDFTGIHKNLNTMKHSFELCLFLGQRRDIDEVFNFKELQPLYYVKYILKQFVFWFNAKNNKNKMVVRIPTDMYNK